MTTSQEMNSTVVYILGTGAPLFVLEREVKEYYKEKGVKFDGFPQNTEYADFDMKKEVLYVYDENGNKINSYKF